MAKSNKPTFLLSRSLEECESSLRAAIRPRGCIIEYLDDHPDVQTIGDRMNVDGAAFAIHDAESLDLARRLLDVVSPAPGIAVLDADSPGARVTAMRAGFADAVSRPVGIEEISMRMARLFDVGAIPMHVQQFEYLFRTAPYGIMLLDEAGTLQDANESLVRMLGALSAQDMVGKTLTDFIARDAFVPLLGDLAPARPGDEKARVETTMMRADGQPISVTLDIGDYSFHGHHGTHILVSDASDRKRLEDQLTFGLFYDRLTQLPNRTLLLDRISRALLSSGPDEHIGILLADLDRFHSINERFGHTFGDQLLVTWASRLRGCIEPSDTIARIGVDDFAIVRSGSPSLEDMEALGNSITEIARHPFRLPRETLNLSATIGAAISDPGQTDAGALLRDGQTALFQAKSSNRTSKKVVVFERSMRAQIIGAHRLMNDLPQAIERNELFLQYQPIIDIKSRQVVGLEALVRWKHPELGPISPSQFIPVAEETGLVLPLGRWVIQNCCTQVRGWLEQKAIPDDLTVNINVATHQLVDAELLPLISTELSHAPLTRRHINLELTESALMENPEASLRVFEQLHDMGIKLYVDDFGTGYSSFSYLTQLPISALKIDRSFVTRMKASTKECEVVRSIVQLAKNLDLRSVAEGVECEEDLTPLVEMGCDRAQGYLFSRPVGGDETPGVVAKLNEAAE